MTLIPGYQLAIAPHFQISSPLINQLHLGTGIDHLNSRFIPRSPWRTPDAIEYQQLVHPSSASLNAETIDSSLLVLQMPDHLRAQWWMLLEQSSDGLGAGPLPGFDRFMDQLGEFLAFKEIPLPAEARGEVVVTHPNQSDLLCHLGQGPQGLRSNLAPWSSWPWSQEEDYPRLWGGFNLGDEPTSIVFFNLSCKQQELAIHCRSMESVSPTTVGQLTNLFLQTHFDNHPVRLILLPGQGYRLPRGGIILDQYQEGKTEIDLMLLISGGGKPTLGA